jgi:heat shock transcription factor 4
MYTNCRYYIGQLPNEFVHIDSQFDLKQEKPPSIFITSHEPNNNNSSNGNILDDMFNNRNTPLTVQTQNIHCNNNNRSLGPYGNQLPPSPSPSMLVSDDELDNSMYSPNSPHTPRQHQHSTTYSSPSFINNNNNNNPLDPLSHR